MKTHRVRSAKSIDGSDKPHLFVEFEQDLWMEVKNLPSHTSIEKYNHAIQEGKQHGLLMYDTRAFEVGLIKDWKEEKPIHEAIYGIGTLTATGKIHFLKEIPKKDGGFSLHSLCSTHYEYRQLCGDRWEKDKEHAIELFEGYVEEAQCKRCLRKLQREEGRQF